MLLIDGIPMNTSYSGQAQALGGIDTEDLKQVEIVRGPFSSLYGSAAMGGVVNFITAMPEASEYKASIGYGDAFEDGRAQQMTKGHLSVAQKFNDRLKAKVSYGWVDSDGYQSDFVTTATAPTGVTGFSRQATNIGGTQYVLGNKGNGAIERSDLTTKIELKPGDLEAQFLDLTPGNRCTGGHIEIERGDHRRSDHEKQECANPLALNPPGGLFISMNNSSSLHNDLYIWAMVDIIGAGSCPPVIFFLQCEVSHCALSGCL
jgi:hypothetical protein